MLENVASLAFKARLKECRRADVFMSCDWRTLMEGRINSVKVVGEGWRSPLDLTAQVLEVGGCSMRRCVQTGYQKADALGQQLLLCPWASRDVRMRLVSVRGLRLMVTHTQPAAFPHPTLSAAHFPWSSSQQRLLADPTPDPAFLSPGHRGRGLPGLQRHAVAAAHRADQHPCRHRARGVQRP